jgi:hypothetical protein
VIRRVAFGKAIIAGIAGAAAWEALIRCLIFAGLPLFDIVRMLGTTVLGRSPAWQWWPVGMALHASVGAIWAIFYAYFFWSTFGWSPMRQGIVFSLGPAILAGVVMVPQLGLMNPLVLSGEMTEMGMFGRRLGWGGPVGIILGHLVYGAVMGSIYTRPVGRWVERGVSHG